MHQNAVIVPAVVAGFTAVRLIAVDLPCNAVVLSSFLLLLVRHLLLLAWHLFLVANAVVSFIPKLSKALLGRLVLHRMVWSKSPWATGLSLRITKNLITNSFLYY